MIKLTRVSEGHYQYQDYEILRSKHRSVGDTKERVHWTVRHDEYDTAVFDTLKEAREFIKESNIEQM